MVGRAFAHVSPAAEVTFSQRRQRRLIGRPAKFSGAINHLALPDRRQQRIDDARLNTSAQLLQADHCAVFEAHAVLKKLVLDPREGHGLACLYAPGRLHCLRNALKRQLGIVGHADGRHRVAGRNEPTAPLGNRCVV